MLIVSNMHLVLQCNLHPSSLQNRHFSLALMPSFCVTGATKLHHLILKFPGRHGFGFLWQNMPEASAADELPRYGEHDPLEFFLDTPMIGPKFLQKCLIIIMIFFGRTLWTNVLFP